jgi:hypothetical protein
MIAASWTTPFLIRSPFSSSYLLHDLIKAEPEVAGGLEDRLTVHIAYLSQEPLYSFAVVGEGKLVKDHALLVHDACLAAVLAHVNAYIPHVFYLLLGVWLA